MQRPNLILTDELMQCLNHIGEAGQENGTRFNRSAFVENILREHPAIKLAAKRLKIKFTENHRFGE